MRAIAVLRYTVLSPLFWLSFAIAVVYGLNARAELTTPGLWEVVLQVSLSSAIFGFAVLPLWLAFSIGHNRWRGRAEFLIRHGSCARAWWSAVLDATAHWCALVFAWIVGLYLSAAGLPPAVPRFPRAGDTGPIPDALAHSIHPLWILLGQLALETVFAIAIAALLRALELWHHATISQLALAFVLFAWFGVGASGAFPDDAAYNLTRYVQVRLILTEPRSAALAVCGAVIVVAIIALAMRVADRAMLQAGPSRWVNILTLHWAISAVIIAVRMAENSGLPPERAAVVSLAGNAGSAIDAIVWSFIYVGMAAVLVVSRSPASRELWELELLRAGSLPAWVAATFRRDAPVIMAFNLTVAVPGILAYFAFGGTGIAIPLDAVLVAWTLIVGATLHAWLVTGVAIVGLMVARNGAGAQTSGGAFGGVVVVFLCSLIPQEPSTWWPFGAANLARVEFGATTVLAGNVAMIVAIVVVGSVLAVAASLQRSVYIRGNDMGTIISVTNVTKHFKDRALLTDLNLRVEQGGSYALTGPNGAGKSVLLKMLCRFLAPTSGSVVIDPRYLSKNRTFPEKFGVSINGPAYLGQLSAPENLRRLARIRNQIGDAEIRAALERVGLDANDRQRVASYSTGMKQKFALAQAIMENPEVLVLDEPFNGLDASSVERIHEVLADFVGGGGTLVFTSHLTGDVDRLAHVRWTLDNYTIVVSSL
jgi:ABC-2 type transport system ATP-binding protein